MNFSLMYKVLSLALLQNRGKKTTKSTAGRRSHPVHFPAALAGALQAGSSSSETGPPAPSAGGPAGPGAAAGPGSAAAAGGHGPEPPCGPYSPPPSDPSAAAPEAEAGGGLGTTLAILSKLHQLAFHNFQPFEAAMDDASCSQDNTDHEDKGIIPISCRLCLKYCTTAAL